MLMAMESFGPKPTDVHEKHIDTPGRERLVKRVLRDCSSVTTATRQPASIPSICFQVLLPTTVRTWHARVAGGISIPHEVRAAAVVVSVAGDVSVAAVRGLRSVRSAPDVEGCVNQVNGQVTSVEMLLARLERVELAAAVMAAMLVQPVESSDLLRQFSHAVMTERRQRETAAHLPQPDID